MAENISTITFLGVDKVTPVVKKIESTTTHSLKEIERRQNELSVAFSNVSSSAKAFVSTIKNLALIGIGAAGSIFFLTKNYANYAEQLSIAASRTGIGTEQFQKLTYAANQNNVSMEELTTSLTFLGRAKAKALADPESEESLAFLGARIDANYLKTHDLKEITLALSQAYSKSTDTSKKLLSAQTLLGRGSGNFFAMLNQGRDSFEATIKEAEKYGYVLSGDALKAANELDDSIDRMFGSFAGLKNMIGEQLVPVLQPMITSWNEWFATNKEFVKLKISNFIKEATIQLTNFWEILKKLGATIWNTVEAVGGLKNIFIAFIALKIAGLVTNLINLAGALISVSKAMTGFSLLSLLNPVTLLIAAVGALALGAYFVWKNWDTLKAKWAELWPWMKAKVVEFLDFVTFGFFSWITNLIPTWEGLKTAWSEMWDWMKKIFTDFIDWLLPKNTWLGEKIRAIWDGFKEYAVSLFTYLKDKFFAFLTWITRKVHDVYNYIAKLFGKEEKPLTLTQEIERNYKDIKPATAKKTFDELKERQKALVTPGGMNKAQLTDKFYEELAKRNINIKQQYALTDPRYFATIAPKTTEAITPLAQTIQNEKKVEAVTPVAPVTEEKPVRLFINMKVDAEGRPKDIKTTSNIPLQFEANTGVIV